MIQTKQLLIALLGVVSFISSANNADLTQEVRINAPRQFADIKNKQVIYYGPVTVTQGSIKINADKLTATQRNGITILIATGEPATYYQIMDNQQPANAQASEIRYNINKRILTLIGKASIDQDGSEVKANKITYNIEKQQMNAEGNQTPDGRVITIIKPENFQEDNKQSSQDDTTQGPQS